MAYSINKIEQNRQNKMKKEILYQFF